MKKGIARSYCVINDKELTSWFSTEGDIVFSTNNFYGNQQGYEYEVVQLLENTVLYAVPIKDLEKLYQTNIEIANWSRILHQEAFIMNEKRLISRLYKSAEERYIELLQTRPDLFQRVNLGYIAIFFRHLSSYVVPFEGTNINNRVVSFPFLRIALFCFFK